MITVYLGNSKKILLLLQSGEDKAWGGTSLQHSNTFKEEINFFYMGR